MPHRSTEVVVVGGSAGAVSLMPQVPRANTNIPAVVIGERIAQLLIS